MDIKEEFKILIKGSLIISISLSYCYFVGRSTPKGFPRLLLILPVLLLFISIPLFFNSVHLIGALSLFIAWLANFKLLLFAFGKGPLSAPSIPLSQFLSFACFPIAKTQVVYKNPSHKSLFNYGIKAILFAVFLRVFYDHGDHMNPIIRILYPTIYTPVHTLSTRVIGHMWAPIPAILTTFIVSGLMHELIFFYYTRDWPTWNTLLFFCLHGVSLVTEIIIKKSVNFNGSLPRYITTPFVFSFVLGTSYWLFFPELMRCKLVERAFEEYQAMAKIVPGVVN